MKSHHPHPLIVLFPYQAHQANQTDLTKGTNQHIALQRELELRKVNQNVRNLMNLVKMVKQPLS